MPSSPRPKRTGRAPGVPTIRRRAQLRLVDDPEPHTEPLPDPANAEWISGDDIRDASRDVSASCAGEIAVARAAVNDDALSGGSIELDACFAQDAALWFNELTSSAWMSTATRTRMARGSVPPIVAGVDARPTRPMRAATVPPPIPSDGLRDRVEQVLSDALDDRRWRRQQPEASFSAAENAFFEAGELLEEELTEPLPPPEVEAMLEAEASPGDTAKMLPQARRQPLWSRIFRRSKIA